MYFRFTAAIASCLLIYNNWQKAKSVLLRLKFISYKIAVKDLAAFSLIHQPE